jgi:cytochrome bd ubiquinol oxidase subunit I
MDPLTAARAQMEISLGFHMIFAAAGMALPLMMLMAEAAWLRTGDVAMLDLARTWGKVTAVLFAIGAVSGTALAFELGLLWPSFMAFAGPLIGPVFGLEGYAFFLEAIFLGLYLFGWARLRPRVHWWCGVPVAVAAAFSGTIVVAANAWMQHPVGFDLAPDGTLLHPDPVAVLLNPTFPPMAAHSTIATYQAVGFAAAGVYAWALLRDRRSAGRARRNQLGVVVAMLLGASAAVAQPVVGDELARALPGTQPAKLAALEGLFATQRGAPLSIGGLPDVATRTTRLAIVVPHGLSLLATHDPNGEVVGLDGFPPDQWPPTLVAHVAFQAMVGAASLMAAVGVAYWWAWWRARRGGPAWSERRWVLPLLVLSAPFGFLALEAGWVVTEVGRQPWIVYGLMPTAAAVTPSGAVGASFGGFTLLYFGLMVTLVFLLRRLAGHGAIGARATAWPDEPVVVERSADVAA